jgi:DNA-binding beta-propeller fold protein YncE
VPAGQGAFTVGEGAVWIVKNDASMLLRIDPELNAVVARVEVDSTEALAAGGGAVWLSNPAGDTVTRIDPRTNKVVARIHVVQATGIAVAPGAVWVANALEPSVVRIDPETNRVVATIRVGPNFTCCSEHMGVFAERGAVWAAVPNGNRLVRIDPATNTVAETVKLPYCPGGYVTIASDALWSAGGGCADVVARIDLRTKALTTLGEPHPVGLAFASGAVWVAVLDSGNVDQIDPSTSRLVARLHVGGTPVVLSTGFGSVWVVDDGGRVLRIDPDT